MPIARNRPAKPPAFVSTQVTDAQRYYLDLTPRRSAPIVVVCGGCERLRSDYVIERRTFPYLCVEFIAEGAGTLELRGRRFPLRPGLAFAYAPGIPHVIRNDSQHPMRKYYVDFVGREAARLLARSAMATWQPVQLAAPQEVIDIFDALQRDALAEDSAAAELCAAHLRVLLLKLAHKGLPPTASEPRAHATYQRARRHLEERYAELMTAQDAARGCHMTAVHLSRVFRRFARTTPYHFLMRLKMNRAAELLLDSGLLVKEAAEQLGFTSQFQFSRAFKRVYGLAPEHFVRRSPRRGSRPLQ